MIWFKLKELEQQLKARSVSEKTIFNYLLLQFVLNAILISIPFNKSPFDINKFIDLLIGVFATVLTMNKTYQINSEGDQMDYFQRFIALSFVCGIQGLLYVMILFIPLGVILKIYDDYFSNVPQLMNILERTYIIGIYAVFYYILINSFKRVNSISKEIDANK
jgi:hypothetical protein